MASPFLNELQQHTASLRRLARDLVGATAADDVLQDAAVEVLRATPPAVANPVAWLHGVVAHMAGKHRRAAAQRRRHEHGAASLRAEQAFTAAGAESADTLRWFSERIAALPEPYRSTLVARYLRDESPTAIAAATGVPVRTVKTRLQRGLALLRERCGERGRDWRLALVAGFALPRRAAIAAMAAVGTVGTATWILGMTTKTKLLLSSLLLVVGVGAWLLLPQDAAAGPMALAPRAVDTPALATADPRARPPAVSAEAKPPLRELVEAAPLPPAPAIATLRGRIVDSRGEALADVPMALLPFDTATPDLQADAEACTTRSDAFGQFAFAAAAGPCAPAAGPGWFTLRTTPWQPGVGEARELLVVAAPAVEVTGRTTRGDDGTPLADVVVAPNLMSLAEFPSPLGQTFVPVLEPVRSSATGEYRLARAPLAAGVQIGFFREGFQSQQLLSQQAAGGRLDVALEPLSALRGRIHGRVRDASGPVADAELQLGNQQLTRSDALGEFTFELPSAPSRLLAVRRGWQPVALENVGANTPEVEVLFVKPALTIGGTLQFADGRPAPGWRIDLADPTRGYGYRPIEYDSQRDAATADCFATTDAGGQFVVGGLGDRAYQLLAYEPGQLSNVISAPIPAGAAGVLVEIPLDAVGERLRGLVVDRRGTPIAGASVTTWLAVASAETHVAGPSATSDAIGAFELANAPHRGVRLCVAKDGWVAVMQPIEVWSQTGADLRIVLDRLCAVRIEGEAELVVQFLDADGKALWAECTSQNASMAMSLVTLHGGRSPVLSLPESTATMLWMRGDREVGRKAVALDTRPDSVSLLIAGQ